MSEINLVYSNKVKQLKIQNENFKKLLDMIKDMCTKNSDEMSDNETKFLQQTLMFLDYQRQEIESENEAILELPCTKSCNDLQVDEDNDVENYGRRLRILEAEQIDLHKRLLDIIEKTKRDIAYITGLKEEQEKLLTEIFESGNILGFLQVPEEVLEEFQFVPLEVAKEKIKRSILAHIANPKVALCKCDNVKKVPASVTDEAGDFRSIVSEDETETAFSICTDAGDIGFQVQEKPSILNEVQHLLQESKNDLSKDLLRADDSRINIVKCLEYLPRRDSC